MGKEPIHPTVVFISLIFSWCATSYQYSAGIHVINPYPANVENMVSS
jgi:hypothetical protein